MGEHQTVLLPTAERLGRSIEPIAGKPQPLQSSLYAMLPVVCVAVLQSSLQMVQSLEQSLMLALVVGLAQLMCSEFRVGGQGYNISHSTGGNAP